LSADKTYRFQEYKIFQLASKQVSLSDIANPEKARLVAQCDIEDGISKIINFEFDEDLSASVPVERVDGEDKGIRHSFSVKTDLFAQGNPQLVNFKRYYYMAVSYAHNNYETYIPDEPNSLDGQKKRYLPSRKAATGEVRPIEAIPHNPMPEADGTLFYLNYGQGPEITRLDGHGNGNLSLELSPFSSNFIQQFGSLDKLIYAQNNGPIKVKVIDPLNLADGYFECKFKDYIASSSNGADTDKWVIYRYTTEGGDFLDSITSEKTIQMNNEKLIPQWGVSVLIKQKKYTGNGAVYDKTTEMIDATIEFADSSRRWLGFVEDNDAFFPTNWIRSGDYAPQDDPGLAGYECQDGSPDYLNPCFYRDEIGVDPDKNFSKILSGGIAPHRLVGYQADFMPLAYYNMTSPGTSRNYASISFLPSVDIILTTDKNKWTRCPVIELGRDENLNVGSAKPGQMRKSPSVNKYGQNESSGTGMSWFPGYAIDLETGARLYMAFGENSFLGDENGADMIWNPTDRLTTSLGEPVMGGMHPIYIFSTKQSLINNFISGYDFPAYIPSDAENITTNAVYQKMLEVETNSAQAKRELYGSLSWIAYPLLNSGQQLLSTDVKILLRINKEYKNYSATGLNGGKPMYSWNMSAVRTETSSVDALKETLRLINVVPNPYNAFSEYENNKLDTRVKITNLPEKCTIRIYNTQGKLIKLIQKDSPATFQDWTLTNHQNIAVASGIYLIHVDVPEIGDRVLKLFVAMRTVDLQNM